MKKVKIYKQRKPSNFMSGERGISYIYSNGYYEISQHLKGSYFIF